MVSKEVAVRVPQASARTGQAFDERELGSHIRELRIKRNMSLRTLADQSGVSPSFLSQVERGATSPSIATLMRIAQALDRTIGSLFEYPSPSRLVRKGEGVRLVHPSGEWDEVLLTPREFSHLQVIRSTLAAGGSTGAETFTYGSSETSMIVESGQVEVELDGERVILMEGDCLSYEPATPHRIMNTSDVPCVIVFVSGPPSY